MPKEVFGKITYDTIFKIAFTKESKKSSLLFLLNSCLKEVLKEPIIDVTIIQTVESPENVDGRFAVFDMQCKSADGTRFIVEMQVWSQKYFIKRTFFCLCRAVSNLVEKGKMKVDSKEVPYDYNIPVIYTLSFLNFEVDFGEGCGELIQYLSVHNDLHPEVRYNIMHMVYVMLPRFEKKWADCKDAFEQLIFLFKNINTLHKMPAGCKDKALEAILKSAKISKLSPEELMDYERQKKVISDYAAALAYAKGEGKGEVAKAMKTNGEAMDKIMLYTGLSHHEIKAL